MPDKQLHAFSIKLQNKGMGRRRSSVSSLEETGTTCTCKASEGFSMSCPDVIKIMDAAGLTTEAVSYKILHSAFNFNFNILI